MVSRVARTLEEAGFHRAEYEPRRYEGVNVKSAGFSIRRLASDTVAVRYEERVQRADGDRTAALDAYAGTLRDAGFEVRRRVGMEEVLTLTAGDAARSGDPAERIRRERQG